jgi:hypothetical protein
MRKIEEFLKNRILANPCRMDQRDGITRTDLLPSLIFVRDTSPGDRNALVNGWGVRYQRRVGKPDIQKKG